MANKEGVNGKLTPPAIWHGIKNAVVNAAFKTASSYVCSVVSVYSQAITYLEVKLKFGAGQISALDNIP